MSAAPAVAAPQNGAEHAGYWQSVPFIRPHCEKAFESPPARFMSGEISSSGDELTTKVRKPYTITKQRERWTEDEHQKFLEALKLFGRAWRRIEEHIGTKTAVQIRSHAQKFFSKLEREASNGGQAGKLKDIEIPPPRPKRKPSHPYPRKAGAAASNSPSATEEDNRASPAVFPVLSSMPGLSVPTHIGGSQPAAFTPYIGKGGPALGATCLQDLSLRSSHLMGSQGSLKLFGKTVVVPTSHRVAATKDLNERTIKEEACRDSFFKEGFTSPSTQTSKSDPKHKEGFLPYLKVGKKLAPRLCETISSDTSALRSGISTVEGTGESNGEDLSTEEDAQAELEGLSMDEQHPGELDTNSQYLSRKQSLLQEPGVQDLFPKNVPVCFTSEEASEINIDLSANTNRLAHPIPAVTSMDRQFPVLAGPLNGAPFPWMDNFFHYYTRLPVPAHTSCGRTDVPSANPTMPWGFLQAATLPYPAAAYAAAIASAGWPGLLAGAQAIMASAQTGTSEGCNVPTFLDDVGATAVTAAAASAWWALRGVVPPGFVHPAAGAMFGCIDNAGGIGDTYVAASAITSATPVGNIEVVDQKAKRDEDQNPDSTTDDEAATSENFSKPENARDDDHGGKSVLRKEHCISKMREGRDYSSPLATCEISGDDKLSPLNRRTPPEAISPVISPGVPISISCSKETEKARTVREQTQQSPCSSADEIDGGKKRSREGSSSGSNTPICGHRSSEADTPNTSGSDVNGNNTFVQKHSTCDNACEHTNHETVLNGNSCPKMRFKHLEKGKKHQHKDRHGEDDSAKRFKSCVPDMDLRKGVSQEGRKAFQALFTYKTLPQTFPLLNSSADLRFFPGFDERKPLWSSQSTEESAAIDIDVASGPVTQSERDSTRYANACGSLLEIEEDKNELRNQGTDTGGKLSKKVNKEICSNLRYAKGDIEEESVKCQSFSSSKEATSSPAQSFRVGSRSGQSGFVPYRRPLVETKAYSHSYTENSTECHKTKR